MATPVAVGRWQEMGAGAGLCPVPHCVVYVKPGMLPRSPEGLHEDA